MPATVQATSSGNFVGASGSVNLPSGVVAGDLLLAVQSTVVVYSIAPTPPAGWTRANSFVYVVGAARLTTYTKVATGSEPASYTFNSGVSIGGDTVVVILDVTYGSTSLDNLQTASRVSSTAAAASVTTVQDNELVLGVAANNNGATFTALAPYARVASKASVLNEIAVDSVLQGAAGVAPAYSTTLSSSSAWGAVAFGVPYVAPPVVPRPPLVVPTGAVRPHPSYFQ